MCYIYFIPLSNIQIIAREFNYKYMQSACHGDADIHYIDITLKPGSSDSRIRAEHLCVTVPNKKCGILAENIQKILRVYMSACDCTTAAWPNGWAETVERGNHGRSLRVGREIPACQLVPFLGPFRNYRCLIRNLRVRYRTYRPCTFQS